MKSFLKENWLWIVLPSGLMILAVVLLLAFTGSGEDGQGFMYNIW
ncbi:MAG: hypothetical protein AAF368_04540 [Planctomycetota bacterium]